MQKHYVRSINVAFLMNDTTILIRCAWFSMLCEHVDSLNQNFSVFVIYSKNFAFFVFIFTSDNFNHIAFFNFHS